MLLQLCMKRLLDSVDALLQRVIACVACIALQLDLVCDLGIRLTADLAVEQRILGAKCRGDRSDSRGARGTFLSHSVHACLGLHR